MIELEKKAKEYADKTEFTECANPSLSESLNISEEIKQAYIDGAKEMQRENDTYWQNIITEQHKLVDECRIKLEKENEQLKAQIEKMKNCWNCRFYNVGDTTCVKGKPHNSGGCIKDWELAE